MRVVFDDINGVSSKKKFMLHIETLSILYQRFGVFGSIRYLIVRAFTVLSNVF